MYAAVPRIIPCTVAPSVSVGDWANFEEGPEADPTGSIALARPKSRTLTLPSTGALTFWGLRSRWTIPFSCASSSASRIWRAIVRLSSRESGPASSLSASVGPSTSSRTRARMPLDSSSP